MKMLNKINRISRRKLRRLVARPCAVANQLMPEMRISVGRANETMNFAMPSARTINQTSPFAIGNGDPLRLGGNNNEGNNNNVDKGIDCGKQLTPIDASFSLPINYLQLCAQ